ADVDDTREQVAMLRAVNEIRPGAQPIQVWEKMRDAAMAPRRAASESLTGILLKPTNWNFKQSLPIHKKLHGHFMQPGVEFFVPGLGNDSSLSLDSTIARDSTLIRDCKNGQESDVLRGSKNDVLQLFLYVSPLVYAQNCAQMLILNSSLIFTGIHLVPSNIGGTWLIRRWDSIPTIWFGQSKKKVPLKKTSFVNMGLVLASFPFTHVAPLISLAHQTLPQPRTEMVIKSYFDGKEIDG